MAEIRTVTTLNSKRLEIEATIGNYERKLEQARADLSAVIACIALFEASGDIADVAAYADLHRLFKRGEVVNLCKAAMRKEGPLTTVRLAERVMAAKGLDLSDKVLRKAISYKIIQALRMQHKRGKIKDAGRAKGGVRIWTLP